MTWTDVPGVDAGVDELTAAMWNTYVRGNLHHLRDDLHHLRDDLGTNYYYRSHIRQSTWVLDAYVKHPIGIGHRQESDGSTIWSSAGPTAIGIPTDGFYLLIALIKHQWNVTIEARFKYAGAVIEDFGINGFPPGGGSIAPYVSFATAKQLTGASSIELEIKPVGNLPAAGNMTARLTVVRIR